MQYAIPYGPHTNKNTHEVSHGIAVAPASEFRRVLMTKRKQSLYISIPSSIIGWSWNLHLQTFIYMPIYNVAYSEWDAQTHAKSGFVATSHSFY